MESLKRPNLLEKPDDVLFYKRCAFGSKYINGRLDLMILRGSTNDGIIQNVTEEFFDSIFEMESSVKGVEKQRDLKDLEIIGWAGGSSILRVMVDAKGSTNLLAVLQDEWSNFAYRLARKLDLGMKYDPDRTLRFLY